MAWQNQPRIVFIGILAVIFTANSCKWTKFLAFGKPRIWPLSDRQNSSTRLNSGEYFGSQINWMFLEVNNPKTRSYVASAPWILAESMIKISPEEMIVLQQK
jgi:hypothetical protein